jgi:hypothetical protein
MSKIWDWIRLNSLTVWVGVAVVTYISFWYFLVIQPSYIERKTLTEDDFKGGIQNHLVWSVKGECYFVKPKTLTDVRLVRVEDCDRTNTVNTK